MFLVKNAVRLNAPNGQLKLASLLFSRSYAIYSREYLDPPEDPNFYKERNVEDGDIFSMKKIKAAPGDQTYSVFYDPILFKFRKMLLKKGKNVVAEKIISDMLYHIKEAQLKKYYGAAEEDRSGIELDPIKIISVAFENIMPTVGLKSVKVNNRTYDVPYPLVHNDRFFKGSKWIIEHAKRKIPREGSASGKPNTPMGLRLSAEILKAYQNQGQLISKKLELHRNAESKRAYAHLLFQKN